MMRYKWLFPVLLLLSLMLGRAAPSAAFTPRPPTTTVGSMTLYPSQDNTLYEDAEGALSNGAGQYLFVGRTNQPDGAHLRRGLVQFDVPGALPANATILSATVYLSMTKTALTVGQSIGLHRTLSAWGEGTSNANLQEGSGAPATPGDATWVYTTYSTTQWTTVGGDFVITPSAAITVAGLGLYAWQTPELAADVQYWLANPTTNHGWLLLGNETVNLTAKRFNTREFPTETARPRLVVFYEVPNYPVYVPLVQR